MSKCSTTLLLRIDKSEKIQQLYNRKQLEFSCPANWVDYENKYGNNAVGDISECVFVHYDKSDIRQSNRTDLHGKAMGNSLLISDNDTDESVNLQYIPVLLTPSICFYSLNFNETINELNRQGSQFESFEFSIHKYCEYIKCLPSESSLLLIDNPKQFIDELKKQVANKIKNCKNVTSNRFYTPFNPKQPLSFKNVDYSYSKDKPFEIIDCGQEIFCKDKKYSYQNEIRIIINNINFKKQFPAKQYNYKMNTLTVSLPHLNDYAKVFSLNEINYIACQKDKSDPQSINYYLINKPSEQ